MADPACKWEKCKLVDACVNSDDIKCGPFGTQLGKDEYTTEGVAVWEIPQINSEFKTSPTHFVTEKKAAELDSYSIIPGDIAMSRKGNVGRCAVFPLSFENGIIHSDVLRIRLDATKAFPEFMMRQLHYSGDIQHQIELVSSGAIMAGINVTKLKQIFVYLPPVDLQGEFVTFVAQVDKSKSVIQKSLDETQLLFDKLMQDYFG
jgi:type I restriction enzyme S subunit